jgi:hypothetical protein
LKPPEYPENCIGYSIVVKLAFKGKKMSKTKNKKIPYIHIGFPKCASTTLQIDFFGKHPQILHLGIGYDNGREYSKQYIDDDVAIAVEMELKYKKDLVYDTESVKSIFQKYFDIADKDENISAVGISSENLSLTFTTDIDVTQKAGRLLDIFGPDTKIIILIRNQYDFIQSMYSTYLQNGYPNTFAHFLEFTYALQERNFLSDILYYNIYRLYGDLFGPYNIHITPFERLKDDPRQFQKELCAFLNIEFIDLSLNHVNKALPIAVLEFVRQANDRRRHGLGNPIWDGSFNDDRLIPYFTKCLRITPPAKAVRDFEIQEEILREAWRVETRLGRPRQCWFKGQLKNVLPHMVLRCIRKMRRRNTSQRNTNGTRAPEINRLSSIHSLDFPEKYRKRFFEMFAPNNFKLSQSTGIDLRSYNYPMPR